MFCAECTLLDVHRDFAGHPAWLQQEGVDGASQVPGSGAVQRVRYRCRARACGARWLRISDPAEPGKRRWEMLLDGAG
jgi:hypothetical protein